MASVSNIPFCNFLFEKNWYHKCCYASCSRNCSLVNGPRVSVSCLFPSHCCGQRLLLASPTTCRPGYESFTVSQVHPIDINSQGSKWNSLYFLIWTWNEPVACHRKTVMFKHSTLWLRPHLPYLLFYPYDKIFWARQGKPHLHRWNCHTLDVAAAWSHMSVPFVGLLALDGRQIGREAAGGRKWDLQCFIMHCPFIAAQVASGGKL